MKGVQELNFVNTLGCGGWLLSSRSNSTSCIGFICLGGGYVCFYFKDLVVI